MRDLPTVAELFDFMRDAELRFGTLRLRIEERAQTARGEELTHDGRHPPPPGRRARSRPPGRRGRQGRVRDLDLRRRSRPDLRERPSASAPSGPIRNRPRGLDDRDFPGPSRVYEPVTALPDGDPARHLRPPRRLLPERPGHRSVHGHAARTSSRDARRSCSSATTRGRPSSPATGPTSTSRSRSIARPACILRLVESIGGVVTRDAEVVELRPDAPLPPTAFDFVFPTGTTMLY